MGDINGHISLFRVKNFKRFETFEMGNLGQFNLIVGDNNVGKTSLLEALLVCYPGNIFIDRLLVALTYRKFKSVLHYSDLTAYEFKSGPVVSKNEILFYLELKDQSINRVFLTFDRYQNLVLVASDLETSKSFKLNSQPPFNQFLITPFIPFFKGHDDDLTKFYREIQQSKSAKESFIRALKIIIPDIQNIELTIENSNDYLIIHQEHIDASIPLAFFGDGALKVFRLLVEIVINRGGRLMIDEIDTGIHFSRFKGFWKTILKAAKENDVQLFMTTHNEECIKYFKEVLEEDLREFQSDTRLVSLVENVATKVVTSHTLTFDQFEHAINMGNEVRT